MGNRPVEVTVADQQPEGVRNPVGVSPERLVTVEGSEMSTTEPEAHRHTVKLPYSDALRVAWCRCGATLEIDKNRWGPPKHTTGLSRAATWSGEEA